jgi:hypothetical protein
VSDRNFQRIKPSYNRKVIVITCGNMEKGKLRWSDYTLSGLTLGKGDFTFRATKGSLISRENVIANCGGAATEAIEFFRQ